MTEDKKTDMLTVEQFNETEAQRKSNCLGFAIGVHDHIELDYIGVGIDESFSKRLSEYGMIVKRASSLEEIRGKTGFIVYGFYPMRSWFTKELEYNDFHIVRVNPDGSLVHKQDDNEPAKHVELSNPRGGINEYDAPDEPIFIFSLEEERNPDKDSIRQRATPIVEQMTKILEDPSVSIEEKTRIKNAVIELRQKANDANVSSNSINIMLQEIRELARTYQREEQRRSR